MNRALAILVFVAAAFAFAVLPAMALEAPIISLERVEVANIQFFYDIKPKIKTDKEPKEVGAGPILNLAYILDIKNPNKEPIMLDELTFTTAFDGFEVNTANEYEHSWIPGGKTNQLKVITTNETLATLGNLMVGAGNVERMKEMKTTAPALIKKWWTTVGDFSFPITITDGTALFKGEKGKEVRSNFKGTWPKKGK